MRRNNFFEKSIISKNEWVLEDERTGIELWIKREDLLHPEISGNKFRKLKYNLLEAKKLGKTKLLTFGGAFSNHISATAAAGKEFGFQAIGVIRGEELGTNVSQTLSENATLNFAVSCGMELYFLSRKEYRNKNTPEIQQVLKNKFDDFYLLPEGGTNEYAIKGCAEILREEDRGFDYICCPVGTGGTLAGMVEASRIHQQIVGFSALKGDFLSTEIQRLVKKNNWEIITNYHFGGYGKVTGELIQFINEFKENHGVLLDPIYTGKMLFGIFQSMKLGRFRENTRILAIHTGGLQGIHGINRKLEQKGMSKINIE